MFNTPLAVDQYSRFMVEVMDDRQMMPAPGGAAAIFGRRENGSKVVYSESAEVFDMDIIRGNEKRAVMIHRGSIARALSAQRNTKTQNSTAVSRVFPLIEEEGDISASQLSKRLAGEAAHNSGLSRQDRLRMLAMEHNNEHWMRIARTTEFLAWQSLLTGAQPAILGTTDPNLLYDFKRDSGGFITPGTSWSNVAADIMGDTDGGCDQIRAKGRKRPDVMVLSGVNMGNFVKNTAIKELADNRRIEFIQVGLNNPVPAKLQFMVEAGFNARGVLRTVKGYELWMFTYIDIYDDESGDPQPFMPDDKVSIFSSDARADAYFGPPETLPVDDLHAQWMRSQFGFNLAAPELPVSMQGTSFGGLLRAAVYFDAYQSNDRKNVSIRAQCGPILGTTQTDGFCTITTGL